MENTKKFSLTHTVLYFKGWYKPSKNVFDDLRITLEADGYCGSTFSDSDCIYCILCKMDEYKDIISKAYPPYSISNFYNDTIRKYMFNKINVNINDKLIEYIINVMLCLSVDDFVKTEPDYTLLPKAVTYSAEDIACIIFSQIDKDVNDTELKCLISGYCYNNISWRGDFKDERNVIDRVFPVLKEMMIKKFGYEK